MELDLTEVQYLTFDCYGTLIDWETGILNALRPVLRKHHCVFTDDQLLDLYAELESRAEAGEFKAYREVLRQVVRGFGERFGFAASGQEQESLPESLKAWMPFPDTVPALQSLASRYKLCVISNVDDDLFLHTARHLQVPFHAVITAEQARSYKPSLHNFQVALKKLGAQPREILHIAESLFHDIAPTRRLGIKNIWVNRRKGKSAGATRTMNVQPDVEAPDMKTVAEMVFDGKLF